MWTRSTILRECENETETDRNNERKKKLSFDKNNSDSSLFILITNERWEEEKKIYIETATATNFYDYRPVILIECDILCDWKFRWIYFILLYGWWLPHNETTTRKIKLNTS